MNPVTGSKLKLVSASAVKSRPVEYLEEGRIPLGEIMLEVGFGGLGKSLSTIYYAAAVSNGTLVGDYFRQPKDVIVFAAEDSFEHTIKPRLQAAGADLNRTFLFAYGNAGGDDEGDEDEAIGQLLTIRETVDELNDLIHDREIDLGLVVFDPLISFMAGTEVFKEPDVRAVLNPLGELARRHMLSIIGIIHFNKKTGATVRGRMAHAASFFDLVRVVAVWGQPDEDTDNRRVLAWGKFNLGKMPTAQEWIIHEKNIEFDLATRKGERKVSAVAYVTPNGDSNIQPGELIEASRGAPKRDKAVDALNDIFSDTGWMWSRDLMAEVNRRGLATTGTTWSDAKKKVGLIAFKVGQDRWATFDSSQITEMEARVAAQHDMDKEEQARSV